MNYIVTPSLINMNYDILNFCDHSNHICSSLSKAELYRILAAMGKIVSPVGHFRKRHPVNGTYKRLTLKPKHLPESLQMFGTNSATISRNRDIFK